LQKRVDEFFFLLYNIVLKGGVFSGTTIPTKRRCSQDNQSETAFRKGEEKMQKYVSGKNVIDESFYKKLAPQVQKLWKPMAGEIAKKDEKKTVRVYTPTVEE
jgi:hypothetical protein